MTDMVSKARHLKWFYANAYSFSGSTKVFFKAPSAWAVKGQRVCERSSCSFSKTNPLCFFDAHALDQRSRAVEGGWKCGRNNLQT